MVSGLIDFSVLFGITCELMKLYTKLYTDGQWAVKYEPIDYSIHVHSCAFIGLND